MTEPPRTIRAGKRLLTAQWRAVAALFVAFALLFNSIVAAGHGAAQNRALSAAELSLAADLRILCNGGAIDPAGDHRQEQSHLVFCQICQSFSHLGLPVASNGLRLPGPIASAPSVIAQAKPAGDRHHATPRNRGPPAA